MNDQWTIDRSIFLWSIERWIDQQVKNKSTSQQKLVFDGLTVDPSLIKVLDKAWSIIWSKFYENKSVSNILRFSEGYNTSVQSSRIKTVFQYNKKVTFSLKIWFSSKGTKKTWCISMVGELLVGIGYLEWSQFPDKWRGILGLVAYRQCPLWTNILNSFII